LTGHAAARSKKFDPVTLRYAEERLAARKAHQNGRKVLVEDIHA
jgi:hypothetical protein